MCSNEAEIDNQLQNGLTFFGTKQLFSNCISFVKMIESGYLKYYLTLELLDEQKTFTSFVS